MLIIMMYFICNLKAALMVIASQETKKFYSISEIHEIYDERFINFKKNISTYNKNSDLNILDKAYSFAIEKHYTQTRRSGEPYFEHLFNVAIILSELNLDITTICSGLLHDVLEDTDAEYDILQQLFGTEIADLVDGVTKLSSLTHNNSKIKQAENFRKMILSCSKDLRVILIKFADRLHNMRTLKHMPPDKRARIANETLEIYAPLAHRFGLQKIKIELEDLSLKYIDSELYYSLKKKIEETKEKRTEYIYKTIDPITKELNKVNINNEIIGRPKHFYSIYNKMKKRNKDFEEIYDLLAIRILVEKLEHCYYTLGIVHSLYLPVADRFKDYISMPKINGYQSLHTTVIGPNGQMVEIQIRTIEMHFHAEEGIAAHWRYKNNPTNTNINQLAQNTQLNNHIKWLNQFIERSSDTDSEDFYDFFKIDLFKDEVFIYSPKGDLFTLPKGATALDFAFHIHTNIGNQCIGAKINGKMTTFKTELKNGDTVEILTSINQKPTKDWLNFVSTSKAKHNIGKYFKLRDLEQTIEIGKSIFQDILKKYSVKKDSYILKNLIEYYNSSTEEMFYSHIGRQDITYESLLTQLNIRNSNAQQPLTLDEKENNTALTANFFGIDGLLISYGKCCNPIYGDDIQGYITNGRGISIHRTNCKNLHQLERSNHDKIFNLNWSNIKQEQNFEITIKLIANDRPSLTRDIANELSAIDVKYTGFHLQSTENDQAFGYIIAKIKDKEELDLIIKRLKNIQSVKQVSRAEDHLD